MTSHGISGALPGNSAETPATQQPAPGNAASDLVPLVVHSAYSLLWGPVALERLTVALALAGYRAAALTDRNGMYGLPSFLELAAMAGLRPITGCEMAGPWGRAVLIARSRRGAAELFRLLSERAAILNGAGVGAAYSPHAVHDAEHRRAMASAEQLVVRRLERFAQEAEDDLSILSDTPSLLARLPARSHVYGLLSSAWPERWRAVQRSGHRLVASPEVSMLEPSDRSVQRLLMAIAARCSIAELPDGILEPLRSVLLPAREAEALFAEMPDALQANRDIADSALAEPFEGLVFPAWQDPCGASSAEVLRRLAMQGAVRRYGSLTPEVKARLEYELSIVEEKGFCDYFLVVRDIVSRAGRICGRGSAAASIISYCLGITDVDPIAHHLYFERFLNPGRKDPPDIDVDFAWDERDGILDMVVRAYGEDRCARVANHNCFQFRGALRDTARAFGMPESETSAVEKRLWRDRSRTLETLDPEWRDILGLALRITGLPRNLGTHSGGVVIVPDRIEEHVPVECTGSGIRVTAWDKDGVERAGLVKMDLLGNRSLAVVRDALADLARKGIHVDPATWKPEEDQATVDMLARGDTMGVFYVESPAMRLLQKKTGAGDFEHLVIHSSIIRPAANRFIEAYIERLKGAHWQPLHPALGPILAETFGIMCYQEDVSKVAVALAGFSVSDADAIRKVLAKKHAAGRLEQWKQRFFEGAAARGVDPEIIAQVWDMIMSFSGYSFVKAHSASYAMLSFQSAWLRAHYPAEFMAAVLSNHGGYYSTLAYASEARRMGLQLLPPCVNASEVRCRGEGKAIRWGLGMIEGLRSSTVAAILEARQAGPFRSLDDFTARVQYGRDDAEALTGAGALDSIAQGVPRPRQLMVLLRACACTASQHQGELFSSAEQRQPAALPPSASLRATSVVSRSAGWAAHTRGRALAHLRWLGTTLECHPLELLPSILVAPRTRASQLAGLTGRHVRLAGWLITAKEVLTMKEEPMEFITFEDETASYETVLFPSVYTRYRPLLLEHSVFWVEGVVEESHGAVTLTVDGLEAIPWPHARASGRFL